MTVSMLKRRLQTLREQGERGSILILVVLSALIIVGSAGLAVDVGRLYATKAELSRAVDAAALSGVLEFNGTAGGLTNASTKACAYLQANEPAASCSGIVPDGSTSTLRIQASKSVRLFFLPIFGINTAYVSAKAISGFNDQTLDAVMVLDTTSSMAGAPITNAKTAAINFKNVLLGTSPSGNVAVGVTAYRGCFRNSPMPSTATGCVYITNEVTDLTSNSGTLDTRINALTAPGGSGTNQCLGLAKGYTILSNATYNHQSSSNNRRFMVVLSDGDNYYRGQLAYQGSPKSPEDITVGGSTYPCQPVDSCTGWGSPCHTGTYSGVPITLATETFESNNFSGGTGWTGAWTQTNSPETLSGSAQAGTYKARLNQTDAVSRQFDLSAVSGASISFYVRTSGTWNTSDRFYFETSPDGSSWTVRATYGISGSGQTVISSSYANFTPSITSLVGDNSAYVRFRTNITSGSSNYVFLDSITISDPNTDGTGYIDEEDGSGGEDCAAATSAPRERQLDIQSLNLARAVKQQNIEIFVVGFGACNGASTTTYTAAQCNPSQQITPAAVPSPAGQIGNTDGDNTANQRLLKCVASSTAGTNDHYFYAATAADLPSIFTTIAAQIAHRLVE